MHFENVLNKVIHYESMTEQQKRTFILKLIQHLNNQEINNDKIIIARNFQVCLSIALESSSQSAISIALYAFSIWGAKHPSYLKEYLNIECINSVFNEVDDPEKLTIILIWLKEGLQILNNDLIYIQNISPVLSGILENKLEECRKQSAFLSLLSEIYLLCPSLLPAPHLQLNFTKNIMHCVASFPIPTKPETLKHMENIGNLVTILWENLKLEDILLTLIAMYNIISNTDPRIEVCPAMAHLLSLVNPQVVEGLGPRIVADPQNCNEAFVATLSRLCHWLVVWPTAQVTLVHWIKTLVRLLYQSGRNIVPCQITYEQVPNLLETLCIPICRPGVFSVITVLLMSFQCLPVVFHKIISKLIMVIDYLENEVSEESNKMQLALSKLSHAQMALFPGHPETYQPLMEVLNKYPTPSDEEIKSLIQEHLWMKDFNSGLFNTSKGINNLLSYSTMDPSYHKRCPDQRVGLRNLGNTCYMNSVIQALFMTDDFRHCVLHTVPKANQHLLVKLQHLFTFLCFSDRSFVSPLKFHDSSRPTWFSPGMQQDCSEYLSESPFDAAKPTKFIVHGFVDSGKTRWLKELAASLLEYGDYNVIRVDWGDGSLPMYYQATANTRVAGLEIGYLVNMLISSFYKLDPAMVHCIGHSLGSHVCGYAGEQINKMGRITGMDPAGPYFTGTEYFIHLDPTDATFVDNIHTDADSIFMLGYGTSQAMGNLDFYPNSGHDQPGCDPVSIAIDTITEDMVDSSRDFVACSHQRAIAFFQETLSNENCDWLGHECYDYQSFENGMCYSCDEDNHKCAYMGIRADEYVAKSRQFASFYLDTDKDEPYCMNHYQVSILTAYPPEAEKWVIGHLFITLYGDNSEVISKTQITKKHERVYHGQVKNALFTDKTDVGQVLRVELKWVYDSNPLNPGTYCWLLVCNRSLYVQSIQVSAINHYPEKERLEYTSLTCSPNGSTTKIKDGKTESFLISTECTPIEE